MWSLADWKYLERRVVTDPKGLRCAVGWMDVVGQEGDADGSHALQGLQCASGRYYMLIYSDTAAMQRERAYASLPEASAAYDRLLLAVMDGRVDPAQPQFREDLDD